MKPVRTIGQTATFQKPRDWEAAQTGDDCGVLSVRVESRGRTNYYFSTWRPSDEELARLISGECVELCCCGSQPPVSLAVWRTGKLLNSPGRHRGPADAR